MKSFSKVKSASRVKSPLAIDVEGAVAQASKLRAAASFFSRFLNLIWKIIFRCAEISGIYRVGLIFGYTKKGVVFVKRFLRGFQLKERFPEPSACDPCAQLLYVKSHGKDKEPRFVVLFTPCKEAPEAIILF